MDHKHVWESKSKEMQHMNKMAAVAAGWDGWEDHCRTCNAPVVEFRDKLSEEEYYISGMCQECQDSVFGV